MGRLEGRDPGGDFRAPVSAGPAPGRTRSRVRPDTAGHKRNRLVGTIEDRRHESRFYVHRLSATG